MATETRTIAVPELGTSGVHWGAGGLAGFLAGMLFGGGVMDPAAMMPTVSALYGFESGVVGWIAHLVHSVVFGLLFVALAARPALRGFADRPVRGSAVGAVYGVVVWAVAAAIVMPFWIGAVTPATPPVPNLNWMSFVGHVVYGVALGALYPLFLSHEQRE